MDSLSRTIVVGIAAAVIAGAATAWIVGTGGYGVHPASVDARSALPPEGIAARVPLGDLAGAAQTNLPDSMTNPLEQDAGAVEEGHRLFDKMNCAGCHGYTAKGGMGPDLTDAHWRYGGTPVQIFKSIYEGRPQGMPAWGRALPQRSIWELTRYIESLGGSFPPTAYHAGLQGDLADQGSPSGTSKAHRGDGNATPQSKQEQSITPGQSTGR
ncbi:MAG TPA: c-type cytochrome [Sphingomicrobium sp.]|nr:c-type cytochrome [Sphingomicrobium sp.]